jgi:hypothetical protein
MELQTSRRSLLHGAAMAMDHAAHAAGAPMRHGAVWFEQVAWHVHAVLRFRAVHAARFD